MILKIDQTIFERHIPSAIDPEAGIFDRVTIFFHEADAWLSANLLGAAVYDELQELFEKMSEDELPDYSAKEQQSPFCIPSSVGQIAGTIQKFIVNYAMYLAIPQLDLILTTSGFGIVNSGQVAPASKDRVESLRRSCYITAFNAYDTLIGQLLGNSHIKPMSIESATFCDATHSLIWTESQLRKVTYRSDEGRLIESLRPAITRAEQWIAERISFAQMESLIDKMRKSDVSPAQLQMLGLLKYIISLLLVEDSTREAAETAAKNYFRNVYELMEDAQEEFPEYIESPIYKARKEPLYENKPRDPLFALL